MAPPQIAISRRTAINSNAGFSPRSASRSIQRSYSQRVALDIVNWIARADLIPKYLDEAIDRKVQKNCPSDCWLVVYLNVNWPYAYDIRQRETTQVIAEIKARHTGSFEAISILWSGHLR